MYILITGGAGFIGGQISLNCKDTIYKPIVLDNFSRGNKNLPINKKFLFKGDFADKDILDKIFSIYDIKIVIHMAAFTSVNESIKNPAEYYTNNYIKTLKFIEYCGKKNLKKIIFSSTAACYGPNFKNKINEKTDLKPLNPYGRSKLYCEQALEDLANIYNFKYIIFRYFNVAGADPGNRHGSSKFSEHLIYRFCEVLAGIRNYIDIFGSDYDTRDGTCIRDYIHVYDIANAHIKGMELLNKKLKKNYIFNLGYGNGVSVKEVIEAGKKIVNKKFKINFSKRRKGDLPEVVADNSYSMKTLDWTPEYNNIKFMIKHQLNWILKYNNNDIKDYNENE